MIIYLYIVIVKGYTHLILLHIPTEIPLFAYSDNARIYTISNYVADVNELVLCAWNIGRFADCDVKHLSMSKFFEPWRTRKLRIGFSVCPVLRVVAVIRISPTSTK